MSEKFQYIFFQSGVSTFEQFSVSFASLFLKTNKDITLQSATIILKSFTMFGGSDDPFRDVESFFRKMSQLGSGNSFLSSSGSSSSFSRTTNNGGTFESIARGSFCPPTTITDNGKQFLLDLDVPGIAREDLKVTATNSKLCISGQRRPTTALQQLSRSNSSNTPHDFFGLGRHQTPQISDGSTNTNTTTIQQQFQQLLMDERPVGFFERCFSFPNKIEENDISAQFSNGVLSVAVGHGGNDDGSKEISIR